MNILFDNIIYSKERIGGISSYWYEITRRLLLSKNDIKFIEEGSANSNLLRSDLKINQDQLVPHINFPIFASRLLPIWTNDVKDINIFHSSFYRKLNSSNNFNEITTIHDFTHSYYYPAINRILHNYLKFGTIRRSKGIICISENTLKDLKKFCGPRRDQKVKVIYNGVSDSYFPVEKSGDTFKSFTDIYKREEPYILYVGSRARHKNFGLLIEILSELKSYRLVIVGPALSEVEKASLYKKSIDSRITVFSNLKNEDLNLLYNFAAALIYPSSYEGFGIPVVEAMRAGCPVIALNRSSIPEVTGEAGILLDELNTSSFCKAVNKLKESSYREALVSAGMGNSTRFTWDRCSQEVLDFYQEVAGS